MYGCHTIRTVTSVKWREGPKDTSYDFPTKSLKITEEKSVHVAKDNLELLTLLLPLRVLRSQVYAVLPSFWSAGYSVTEPYLQPQSTVYR